MLAASALRARPCLGPTSAQAQLLQSVCHAWCSFWPFHYGGCFSHVGLHCRRTAAPDTELATLPPSNLALLLVPPPLLLQMRYGKGSFNVVLTSYECLMGKHDRWEACQEPQPGAAQRTPARLFVCALLSTPHLLACGLSKLRAHFGSERAPPGIPPTHAPHAFLLPILSAWMPMLLH